MALCLLECDYLLKNKLDTNKTRAATEPADITKLILRDMPVHQPDTGIISSARRKKRDVTHRAQSGRCFKAGLKYY